MWKEAGRIVTRQEIWNDALLSGAPNRKPLHILDFDIMCSLDDAKKRMLELQGKTRNQVVALFNDAILCAVSPCLKAERHAQRVGVYAKALNRFSGGSWVRSRSSRLQIL